MFALGTPISGNTVKSTSRLVAKILTHTVYEIYTKDKWYYIHVAVSAVPFTNISGCTNDWGRAGVTQFEVWVLKFCDKKIL